MDSFQMNDLSDKIKSDLRLLATVVMDSNDAITIQDFEGNISAWNKGARNMYGYNEVEALAMNIRDIVPPDKSKEALAFVTKLKQGEEVESFESQRVTKDGRIIDVWLTVTGLVNEDGKPIGFATTERDITERKVAEREKEKLINKLKAALAEIKTLQGIVPICAKCKKIRDDDGFWRSVENYIEEHSNAVFSHGMCLQCADELYGGQEWYDNAKKDGKI